MDHGHGGSSHGAHGQSAEEEGKHGADEQARHYFGGRDVDYLDAGRFLEGGKEGQGSKGGRTDGKAFSDRCGGIAYCIQFIGPLAHFAWKFRHLGDASGIVGNGPICVDCKLDAGIGKHSDGGDGDPVQTGELISPDHGDGQYENGEGR